MAPCLISVLPIFYWVFFIPFLFSILLFSCTTRLFLLDLLFFYFLLFSSRLFLSFFSLLLCSLRLLFNTKYYPTVMMQCSITCFALILIFLLSLRTRVSVILIQEAPEQGHRYIQHIDVTINHWISALDLFVFINYLFLILLISQFVETSVALSFFEFVTQLFFSFFPFLLFSFSIQPASLFDWFYFQLSDIY